MQMGKLEAAGALVTESMDVKKFLPRQTLEICVSREVMVGEGVEIQLS